MRDTHIAADICGAFRLIPDSPLMALTVSACAARFRQLSKAFRKTYVRHERMLRFCPFGCTAAHVKQAARIAPEAGIF